MCCLPNGTCLTPIRPIISLRPFAANVNTLRLFVMKYVLEIRRLDIGFKLIIF